MYSIRFPPISDPNSALQFSISVSLWLYNNDYPNSTLIFLIFSLSISPKDLFAAAPTLPNFIFFLSQVFTKDFLKFVLMTAINYLYNTLP